MNQLEKIQRTSLPKPISEASKISNRGLTWPLRKVCWQIIIFVVVMGQGEATPSKATETQVFPAWTPWLNIFLDTLAGKTFRLEFPAWGRNVGKRYPKNLASDGPLLVIDPVLGPYNRSYNPTYNWKGPTLPLEVLGSWPSLAQQVMHLKKRFRAVLHTLLWFNSIASTPPILFQRRSRFMS